MKLITPKAFIGMLALYVCCPCGALAADGPPIKILVGYAAGGGSDTLARALAEGIAPLLGRTVVVENKPGAGGRIAGEALKNAPADGTVLMVAPNGLASIQSVVYKSELRYDPLKDWAPIAKLVSADLAVAVAPSTKVSNAAELITWAKANPSKTNFGSPAAGGLPHFAGLLLSKKIGIPLNHVPYKGGAPVALAVLSDEIAIGVSSIDDFAQHEKAGKLKIIGTMGAKRSTLSPQLPTFAEQGQDVIALGWNGLWTRAGTPDKLIQEISAAVEKTLSNPALKSRLAAALMEVDYADAAQMGKLHRQEIEQWTPIVAASGFKPGQ
jgi:tripartite-type tricarboxylate transporter receptor subunit TctC